YRAQLAKWRDARQTAGKPHDEAARYQMHQRAIGRACSSKEFSNRDLDMVLAVMLAEIAPADFAGQMRIQDQPDQRAADLRTKIDRLAPTAGIERGREGVAAYFRRWLGGRKIEELDERTLQKIVGLLSRRAKQLAPKPAAVDDGNPF